VELPLIFGLVVGVGFVKFRGVVVVVSYKFVVTYVFVFTSIYFCEIQSVATFRLARMTASDHWI
jgi:hypothetical protein